MKPLLLDKIVLKEQILLVQNDEIISEDSKIAESLNSFFSNIVKNLKIPGYRPHNDSLFENVSDAILKVVLKYRNHPSILTIGEVCKNKSNKQPLFSFSQATRDEILKEILSLDTTKNHIKILIYQQRYLRKMQTYFQTFCSHTIRLVL